MHSHACMNKDISFTLFINVKVAAIVNITWKILAYLIIDFVKTWWWLLPKGINKYDSSIPIVSSTANAELWQFNKRPSRSPSNFLKIPSEKRRQELLEKFVRRYQGLPSLPESHRSLTEVKWSRSQRASNLQRSQ